MTRNLYALDIRSLLIVLIAFAGNAQIAGISVGFTLIAATFLLQLNGHWKIRRDAVIPLLFLVGLLFVTAIRSPGIGIPHYDSYWLWPIQGLLLSLLLVLGGGLRWPVGNMIAFSVMCFVIFAMGGLIDGRYYSVFGPNMLYRVFGFMFLFSLVFYFEQKGRARLLLVGFSIFGLFATLLTGSIGALAIIAIGLASLGWRVSKSLTLAVSAVASYWIIATGFLTGSFTATASSPVFVSRLAYKLGNLHLDDRLFGWWSIISEPPSLFGYNYEDFSHLWFFGYQYPHNMFVELYGFYGMFGLVLVVFVSIAALLSARRLIYGDVSSMVFVVLTLGAMFSGDLSDNFGAIALAAGILFHSNHRKLSTCQPKTQVERI